VGGAATTVTHRGKRRNGKVRKAKHVKEKKGKISQRREEQHKKGTDFTDHYRKHETKESGRALQRLLGKNSGRGGPKGKGCDRHAIPGSIETRHDGN